MTLEHQVVGLDEPRPTSVDVFFKGPRQVAVEVKLAESEFGRCSTPQLRPADSNFERDHCDASFTVQRSRKERCALTALGIRYWDFVPALFAWSGQVDHRPCPLGLSYQLIRNVLAACLREGGVLDTDASHALVIYDERNPGFHAGGLADAQWLATLYALRFPRVLRRVSWQRIASHLEQFKDLEWLTRGLRDQYGIEREKAVPAQGIC